MRRLKNIDWEAIAGIVAAVAALLMHLLQVADEGVLLTVAIVLLALILLRDLRREAREERSTEAARTTADELHRIGSLLKPPDAILVGPRQLREESARFARRASGEMVWFNVCLLMFVPQSLFDALLRPAIENPKVESIVFILDERERERWQTVVLPKLNACQGREKVQEPHWRELDEAASFILAGTESGKAEAQLSFWGEPFMSRTPGGDLPRYFFHVQPDSELIQRLEELERQYRLPVRP